MLSRCSQVPRSLWNGILLSVVANTVYSPKRRGSVSQTFGLLEGTAPYRMEFSHQNLHSVAHHGSQFEGICGYMGGHLKGCILYGCLKYVLCTPGWLCGLCGVQDWEKVPSRWRCLAAPWEVISAIPDLQLTVQDARLAPEVSCSLRGARTAARVRATLFSWTSCEYRACRKKK